MLIACFTTPAGEAEKTASESPVLKNRHSLLLFVVWLLAAPLEEVGRVFWNWIRQLKRPYLPLVSFLICGKLQYASFFCWGRHPPVSYHAAIVSSCTVRGLCVGLMESWCIVFCFVSTRILGVVTDCALRNDMMFLSQPTCLFLRSPQTWQGITPSGTLNRHCSLNSFNW